VFCIVFVLHFFGFCVVFCVLTWFLYDNVVSKGTGQALAAGFRTNYFNIFVKFLLTFV
jgi:hypothetical protein